MVRQDNKFYGVIVDQGGNTVTLAGPEILFKASRPDGRWIQISLSGENRFLLEMEGDWEFLDKREEE